MKNFTRQEILNYSSDSENIYVALNGTVYDVSKEKRYYGPKGAYKIFAGHDATFGLGTMTLTCEPSRPLTDEEMIGVEYWQDKFDDKYPVVGKMEDKKINNTV